MTFEKYDKIETEKHVEYHFYFEEYSSVFIIYYYSFTSTEEAIITSPKKGDVFDVYYSCLASDENAFAIFEMSNDSSTIITLSNYKTDVQHLFITLLLLTSFVLMILVLFISVPIITLMYSNPESNLGKVKIEYFLCGNVIRIYNSPYVCSLVINDKVIDQKWGVAVIKIHLKGEIEKDGENILVEAKLNNLISTKMRLYCNGTLVKKANMASLRW